MINNQENKAFEKNPKLTRRCSSKYLQNIYNKLSKLEKSGKPKYFEIMQIFLEDSEIYNNIFLHLEDLKNSIENILNRNFKTQRFKYISEIMHKELVNSMYNELKEIMNLFKKGTLINKTNNINRKKTKKIDKRNFSRKNYDYNKNENDVINESFNYSITSRNSLSNNIKRPYRGTLILNDKKKKILIRKKKNLLERIFVMKMILKIIVYL